jgi:hypothetical protein
MPYVIALLLGWLAANHLIPNKKMKRVQTAREKALEEKRQADLAAYRASSTEATLLMIPGIMMGLMVVFIFGGLLFTAVTKGL